MPPKKRDYANKITDLQPQKSNANKHKEHGERLLRKSVQDYGLADGITVAAKVGGGFIWSWVLLRFRK